jgi:stress-induced morphogen
MSSTGDVQNSEALKTRRNGAQPRRPLTQPHHSADLSLSPTKPHSYDAAAALSRSKMSTLFPRITRSILTQPSRRYAHAIPFTNAAMSQTPIEDSIRAKLTAGLSPRTLEIWNDSHKHAHHNAMRGVADKRETHFRYSHPRRWMDGWLTTTHSLVITSAAFSGKPQIARHRMVNALVKEELEREGGIHALQLRTLTLEEEDRLLEKAREIEKAEAEGKCAGACAGKEGKA